MRSQITTTQINDAGAAVHSKPQEDFNGLLTQLNSAVSKNPTASGASVSSRGATVASANARAASYQSQLDALNSSVANAKQNNWIGYMKALKALPQQMANTGVNGGGTESSLVRLNAAYGGANNDIDREVLSQRTTLEQQLAAAKATANAARKAGASSGSSSSSNYITNANGNIISESQQAELNSIIQRMGAAGYSDNEILQILQSAGF